MCFMEVDHFNCLPNLKKKKKLCTRFLQHSKYVYKHDTIIKLNPSKLFYCNANHTPLYLIFLFFFFSFCFWLCIIFNPSVQTSEIQTYSFKLKLSHFSHIPLSYSRDIVFLLLEKQWFWLFNKVFSV